MSRAVGRASRAAREARVLEMLDRIRIVEPRRYDKMMVLLAQLVATSRKRKERAA